MVIDVVEQINQSDLPPATKANALALLALAHQDNGHLAIDWPDLAAAFGHISLPRCRRHLGLLQSANLIHYSSNGDGIVYINFKAWARVGARKTTTEWSKNDHPVVEKRARTRAPAIDAADDDLTTRVDARKTTTQWSKNARGRAFTHTRADCLIDRSSDPSSEEIKQTNKHAPGPVRSPRYPWEAPLSYRLLTDKRVAMRPPDAERLSQAHPFHHIRDAVAHWLANRKSAGGRFEEHPGIVVYWLDNPDETVVPVAPPDWSASDLGRDYRTPDEIAEEEAAEAEADQRRTEWEQQADAAASASPASTASAPKPTGPDAWWAQLQAELAIEQGGSFDRWVHDTWVISYEASDVGAEFLIGLPDAFRYDWIVHRLSRQIKRKLAVITGNSQTNVKFRVQPRPQPPATNGSNP